MDYEIIPHVTFSFLFSFLLFCFVSVLDGADFEYRFYLFLFDRMESRDGAACTGPYILGTWLWRVP
jgi:hypothetical protein